MGAFSEQLPFCRDFLGVVFISLDRYGHTGRLFYACGFGQFEKAQRLRSPRPSKRLIAAAIAVAFAEVVPPPNSHNVSRLENALTDETKNPTPRGDPLRLVDTPPP